MDYFGLVPSIFTIVLSIALFINAEKGDDYVEKVWSFVLGLSFAIATIYLIELFTSYNTPPTRKEKYKTEYYDDYY